MVHSVSQISFPDSASQGPRSKRPRLLITLGDAAGIGPEVVLKALAYKAWGQQAEITLVGPQGLLQQTYPQ
ncbi:MAG: 4-hydroxythreonine-4-phosphate dehydrogenase, partial [Cyanobacteria bacterium J06635_1]